jgi:hypothetical protein
MRVTASTSWAVLLDRSGGVINLLIGANHGVGGRFQLPELRRLPADPVGDIVQVAQHVRQFHAQRTNAIAQAIEQPIAFRRGRRACW